MKIRAIALCLLMASLLGMFGCVAGDDPEWIDIAETQPDFITGNSETLNSDAAVVRPEKLLNFAAADKNGKALFQIVYDGSASIFVKNECERLADDIYSATGEPSDRSLE